MGILSFPRHYKLWGILSDPGDSGGEEGGWHGYPEERQDAFARREEDGKAESQASHRRWLWVQERNANMSFPYFFKKKKKVKSFTRNMLYMESGTQWQFSSPRSQLSAISTSFHWNLGVLNLKLLIPGQNISLPAYFASKIGMQLYSVPVCEITPFFPFLLPHI